MYRGDIEQVKTEMSNGQLEVDDNIKSGWLKHLDINDLCEVIAVARQNLPDTDFMYNDDNLIDPNKLEPTMELLQQIRCCDFAINELALYLDTHPTDEKALCLHRKYCREAKDLKDKYQKVYGPLTINFPCNKWRWFEEPWPWEGGMN